MNTYKATPPEFNPKKLRPIIIIGGIVLLLLIFGKSLTVTIGPGQAGLLFQTFGNGIDPEAPPMEQGFHFKAPWDDVLIYEVRQQEITETMTVLSSNLLNISMDITVFFQPQFSNLGRLELERGRRYKEDVIMPAIRSVLREVIAMYIPEEINSTKRELIQKEVFEGIKTKLAQNYVQINDLLIRNIELPQKLKESIERKLQQEQESLEYEFRIQKAEKEAERKKIEAQGIQDFQRIVTQSITKDLLKWKGIEATESLAKSDNAKVIVIGNGEGDLPIILGGNN